MKRKTIQRILWISAMGLLSAGMVQASCPCAGGTKPWAGQDACGNNVCDPDDIGTYPYTDACGNGVCLEPDDNLECCDGIVFNPESICCDDGIPVYIKDCYGDGSVMECVREDCPPCSLENPYPSLPSIEGCCGQTTFEKSQSACCRNETVVYGIPDSNVGEWCEDCTYVKMWEDHIFCCSSYDGTVKC